MKHFILIAVCSVMLFLARAGAGANDSPIILQSIQDTDWYPIYYFSGKERRLEGLLIELVDRFFAEELDLQRLAVPRPWARAQREVEEGITDFFISTPTDDRKRYTLTTTIPLFRLYLNLYTYAHHPRLELIKKIRTVEDIKALDLVLVSNYGNGWHKSNIEEQGIFTQWVAGDDEIIRFLAMKRADAMIDVALPMNHRIEQLGLSDKLVKTDVIFGPIDFYIMIGKKSKYASRIDEINRALQRLQDQGVLQQIWSKYN